VYRVSSLVTLCHKCRIRYKTPVPLSSPLTPLVIDYRRLLIAFASNETKKKMDQMSMEGFIDAASAGGARGLGGASMVSLEKLETAENVMNCFCFICVLYEVPFALCRKSET
jgi:hypothetical protein